MIERKNGREIFRELKTALEINNERESVKLVWGLSDKVWLSEDSVKELINSYVASTREEVQFRKWLLHKLDGVDKK